MKPIKFIKFWWKYNKDADDPSFIWFVVALMYGCIGDNKYKQFWREWKKSKNPGMME